MARWFVLSAAPLLSVVSLLGWAVAQGANRSPPFHAADDEDEASGLGRMLMGAVEENHFESAVGGGLNVSSQQSSFVGGAVNDNGGGLPSCLGLIESINSPMSLSEAKSTVKLIPLKLVRSNLIFASVASPGEE